MGAAHAILIGESEVQSGRFAIKPMAGGDPVIATLETLVELTMELQ